MIILLGVAGAGKSTQGRLLADEYGLAWLSTGELLRVLITGRRRQEMLEGKLLRDDEMTMILDKLLELVNTNEQFVLDGFPRTIPQVEWLLQQAENGRFDINAVFNFVAEQDVVRERLRTRGRVDDTDNAIAMRFEEYEKVTVPIIGLLKQRGVHVYDIDASQPRKEVHDELVKRVKSLGLITGL